MAKSKVKSIRPALSDENRENRMISLAMDVAEQQLLEGTASSQVITHFLKLGTTKAKLELEREKKETALIEAKTQNLKSMERIEALYANALSAMKSYSGQGGFDEDEEDY